MGNRKYALQYMKHTLMIIPLYVCLLESDCLPCVVIVASRSGNFSMGGYVTMVQMSRCMSGSRWVGSIVPSAEDLVGYFLSFILTLGESRWYANDRTGNVFDLEAEPEGRDVMRCFSLDLANPRSSFTILNAIR